VGKLFGFALVSPTFQTSNVLPDYRTKYLVTLKAISFLKNLYFIILFYISSFLHIMRITYANI
jgi:hypothetical protein